MRKHLVKRLAASAMSAALAATLLAGCGGSGSSAAAGNVAATTESGDAALEPVTLKILFKGPKPEGWDAVY